MNRKLFFVINPHASTVANWAADEITREFERHLPQIDEMAAYELFLPHSPAELKKTLEERLARDELQRVIACGGDGTITDILEVLVHYAHVPLGIIPLGTGNLLALNMGIPFGFREALEVAVSGPIRPVDLARMNEHVFVLNASVGIDAEIMARTDKELKKRWGILAYFIQGIPMLHRAPRARLRIEADGKVIRTRAIGVTVFNAGSKVPGGIELFPGAKPDDGLLHGTIFKTKTWLDYCVGFFQLLLSVFGHKRKVIQFFEGSRIRIEARPALKTQADGNVIGTTPVTMEIITPRLQICVPAQ